MRIWRSGSDKGAQIAVSFDSAAELPLQADDLPGEYRTDAGGAGELVFISENAELARAAAPAHVITWMGADTVSLDNGPHF